MSTQPYLIGLEDQARRADVSQWYSPPETARRIADFAMRGWRKTRGINVLEPSCGRGALIAALLEVSPKAWVYGVDIDPANIVACQQKWIDDPSAMFECADFTSWHTTSYYDMAVMNPPFEGGQTEQHILHALQFCDRVVAHGPLTTLAGQERGEGLWKLVEMPRMAICSTRPKYGNGTGGSTEMATFELRPRRNAARTCKTQIEWWK